MTLRQLIFELMGKAIDSGHDDHNIIIRSESLFNDGVIAKIETKNDNVIIEVHSR